MLNALVQANLTLRDWLRDMPVVSRRSRSVAISPAQTGRILRAMARREQHVEFGGGMRFHRKEGWVWICPDEEKSRMRIVTESTSEEYARELCDFCERELKRIASEKC
jgi:phosphomannomutase